MQHASDQRSDAVSDLRSGTFIQSDPGHAKADKPRGDKAKTRRSKDGTWSKKSGKSYYGYKLHTIIDADFELIRRIKTTTASVHDTQVDLSMEGEVTYKDKGYFGVNSKGYDATMQRGVRGHSIGIKDVLRNKRINHTRAKCERIYAVMKTVFRSGSVKVTTTARAGIKMLFTAFDYNLYQLCTLKKKGMIE
jgi:IS5 family transposase